VSPDFVSSETLRGVESGTDGLLRVETVFHLADESQGQAVAAKLIDRAHELANSPECECDVDVSVQWVRQQDHVDSAGGPVAGESPATARIAER
jgi:hypothetical protein